MKKKTFVYAQMHLKLYNIAKLSAGLAAKYSSDQLEHVSILVSDFHPVWQLLTAARAEIYFHSKFSTVAQNIDVKSSWA